MNEHYDELESASPQAREERQARQLREMVKQGYEKARRFMAILDECGIRPADIRAISDIEMLPVISREKLVEMELADLPYGGLADTAAEIDRIFVSPGPVYEPHLSETDPLWARAYFAAGIREGDIVLNAFSYHMVAAGLTFHGGLRRVGATVVPSGSSGTQAQVQLIRDLGVTAYTGTPSFLLAVINKAQEMGHDFRKDFRLTRACFGAEPLAPTLRRTFEKDYAIDTYQMYGATEVGDVAFECGEKAGWHICEEVLVEICDPLTGKRTAPGALGEVVVTRFNPLFFLLRFGTGDLSRIIEASCPCGRTSYRLDGIAGRVGDAVKVRGLFVAPSQLKKIEERFTGWRFQVVVGRTAHEDVLSVRLEPKEVRSDAEKVEKEFRTFFKEVCTVSVDRLEFLPPGTFADGYKPIVDERSWT